LKKTSSRTDDKLKLIEQFLPMKTRQRISAVGLSFEHEARACGFRFIAGVDEVGRGALAGPVVAAACILDPAKPFPDGLDDSKKLSSSQRERIAIELKSSCLGFAVGQIEADEIDRINILRATRRAMIEALGRVSPAPDYVLIDALHLSECSLPQKAIIRGDSISASIAAASIIAKTYRDELMREYHNVYPQFGFASNVGYGTAAHLSALRASGACAIHRMTFRGVLPEQGLEFES
jgi:ribonuclease HII